VRLAQVTNKVGLLPLQPLGVHLLALSDAQECPDVLEVRFGDLNCVPPNTRALANPG
jgi:hypothetical protein